MRIIERVFGSYSRWTDVPAFIELTPGQPPVSLTGADFISRCDRFEADLRAAGIGDRSPVALFVANSIDFVALFLALLRMRALPAAIKLEYRSFELQAIFANLDPGWVIADEHHLPVIEPYVANRTLVVHESDGALRLQQKGPAAGKAEVQDDVASINYTYRGLGHPIGATVTYDGYELCADVLQAGLQAEPGERALCILPMPHIFTIVSSILVPALYGITSVISRTLHPRRLLRYISEQQINHITAVPELYGLIGRLADDEAELASLQALVSGGSHLSSESYAFLREKFRCDVLHGYGLTEFAPVSRNIRGASRPGTIGPVVDGMEWKIAADGELLLRSAAIAPQYYRDERMTAQAWEGDWFRSGDIISRADGHIVFCHEKKRTCKINGNMVDLAEIERALEAHPAVGACSVQYGNGSLSAEVEMKDLSVQPSELRDYLGTIMAPYKVPKIIGERK